MKTRDKLIIGLLAIFIIIGIYSINVYAHHVPEGSDDIGFIVDHWYNGTKVGSGIFTVSSNINFGGLNVTNITDFQAQSIRIPDCSTGQVLESDTNGNLNCVNPSSLVNVRSNYTPIFPGFDMNVTIPNDILIRAVSGSFHITPGVSVARSIDMQVSCSGEQFNTVQKIRVPSSFTNGIHQSFSFSAEGGCVYRFHENETGGSADISGYSFVEWGV